VDVWVRSAESDDERRRSLELFNAIEPESAVTWEEVQRFNSLADASADFLAVLAGDEVGSGHCAIQPQDRTAAFTLVDVLPHARGRGAGSALYAACSAFAREHGRDELVTRVASDDERSLAFATKRGFVVEQRDDGVELDLAQAPPPTPPPPGIEIHSLAARPDLADGAYDVACESLPDIPGEGDWVPPPRAKWVANFGAPQAPDATFLAVADGEVVGYALLRPRDEIAEHGMTAVKRAWRGRGIARALKSAQIEWAKANGVTTLRAMNEQRNAPMLGLNRSLGYVPVRGRIVLRGPAQS
jgi:mycothiol synthase